MGLFDSWSVKDYTINLSSTSLIPGAMLSGNVVFTVDSEMSFRKVTLKVLGYEFNHIAVSSGSGKHRRTHHYYAKRNFFKVHILLLGMPKGGGEYKGSLAPGTYNFPFAVRLPQDALPSMIAGSSNYASIRYVVKSKIDIPFSSDSERIAPFIVACAMPQSQLQTCAPFASAPSRVPRTCCCCSRGFSTVSYSFDKNIILFGPGHVMNGTLTINNGESEEHTKEVTVSIVEHTTFSAAHHTRVAVVPISTQQIATNILAKQQGDHNFVFQLPLEAPPYDNASCLGAPRGTSFKGEFITHNYMVQISCDGDILGQTIVAGASMADPTNIAPIVQSEVVASRTIPKGEYPRFIYAPPPGGNPTVPEQPKDSVIGPFPGTPPLPFIPY